MSCAFVPETAMRRREFISLIGSVAVTWPLAARAQQSAMPRIGFLSSASPDLYAIRLRAFRQGLKEAGYIEGQNVEVEYRWAEGENDRLPAMAADLVRRQVNVIAASGTPSSVAAKAATSTTPIVFETATDPVKIGLVASLSRPGGNLTGVTNLNVEVVPKRLELLRELLPKATVIAVLINPSGPSLAEAFLHDLRPAARTLGMQLHILRASNDRDFDTAFATLIQLRADALVIGPDVLFLTRSEQLAALSLRHAVPTIANNRPFAAAGGLMTYGANQTDNYRLVGIYTGKILKGEKPADLPVMQSTKVELIINLKTAKALGLTVPQSVQNRADEVIE
jgi:putative ABC transport system substrate-binding protein